MAVENRIDNTNVPFILFGNSVVVNADIQQDAQRATPLLPKTVMAQIAASRAWVPFNSVVGVDGSAIPRGIYMGDEIPAADIVAGAIEDVPILMADAWVDENQVIWDDDTLSEDSVIGAATIHAVTARMALEQASGIILKDSIEISHHEN